MSQTAPPIPEARDLAAALRRTRHSVLGGLALVGVAILLRGLGDEDPPPDRWLTTLAVAFGLGTVVLRRLGASPVIRARTSFYFLLGSLLLTGALGLLGAWTAWPGGAPRTGLMFVLAGGIFSARPVRPRVAEG